MAKNRGQRPTLTVAAQRAIPTGFVVQKFAFWANHFGAAGGLSENIPRLYGIAGFSRRGRLRVTAIVQLDGHSDGGPRLGGAPDTRRGCEVPGLVETIARAIAACSLPMATHASPHGGWETPRS